MHAFFSTGAKLHWDNLASQKPYQRMRECEVKRSTRNFYDTVRPCYTGPRYTGSLDESLDFGVFALKMGLLHRIPDRMGILGISWWFTIQIVLAIPEIWWEFGGFLGYLEPRQVSMLQHQLIYGIWGHILLRMYSKMISRVTLAYLLYRKLAITDCMAENPPSSKNHISSAKTTLIHKRPHFWTEQDQENPKNRRWCILYYFIKHFNSSAK